MPSGEFLETWGSGAHMSGVQRHGDAVLRRPSPSSRSVNALLRHLEQRGFQGSPRVLGDGFSPDGRQVVSYVAGSSPHPKAWPAAADLFEIGALLRAMHAATESFDSSTGEWRPWFGRTLRTERRVIGHCDLAPWNIVKTVTGEIAFIDWDFAGPTDVITELAQAGWLNAQLHDDDIAELHDLPDARTRAEHFAALLDGYQLASAARLGVVAAMIEVAVQSAAAEAVEQRVTTDSPAISPSGYPVLWAVAWRARSAAWMVRHRQLLERAATA